MKEGTILHGSWGYEQTNPEFYIVVRATAKSAWLKRLGYDIQPSEGCSPMAGRCVPVKEPAADAKVYGPVRIRSGYQGKPVCNEPRYGHATLSEWDGEPKYVSWYG